MASRFTCWTSPTERACGRSRSLRPDWRPFSSVTSVLQAIKVNHMPSSSSDCSGGSDVRTVSMAMEMLMKPRLVILDEPTVGLDRNSFRHELTVLEKVRHCTMLFSSSELSLRTYL
ncbi:hypothetical protein ZEAMMB73_Zm00001d040966 [Zea mays]|uniref:ABC transporter domain-containing protein n=1 Tax=Zea mays TaxID=4577 RepID=A0A1D6MTM1_MAIZE|nr:hypothetical protein ZEAMMB73_Zm00001d040966 [Zea mays]